METSSRIRWTSSPLVLSGLLVALCLVAYGPAYDAGFIWDDDDYVTHNPVLREPGGLARMWTEPTSLPQWYPVVHTTFWLEWRLWQDDPTGYHVVNVLVHGIAAVLLFRLLTTLGIQGAWLAAALFALHPVHAESVAWVTERKNTLSAAWAFASALWWWRANESGSRCRWGVAFGLFVLALLSKSVTCVLPAVMIQAVYWKRGRVRKGEWLSLAPFFVVGLVLALVTVRLEKDHVLAKGAEWDFSFVDRCEIAGRALWFYAGKLLVPVGLCFNYERWTLGSALGLVAPATVVALVVTLFGLRSRIGRGPLVLTLIFSGVLFPALGFFDVYPMRYSFVADHFVYHASVGLLIAVSWVLVALTRPLEERMRRVATVALVLACATATWIRAEAFHDRETLWRDTLASNPRSWLAAGNLAGVLTEAGRHDEAVAVANRALAEKADHGPALTNLGVALYALDRRDQAEAAFRRAVVAEPTRPQAQGNLGLLLLERGDLEGAVAELEAALAIEPRFLDARVGLFKVYAKLGRGDDALREAAHVLGARPADLRLRLEPAGDLLAKRQRKAALALLQDAIKRHPESVTARRLAARASRELGLTDQALLLYVSVLHFTERDPDTEAALRDLTADAAPAEAVARLRKVGSRAPVGLLRALESLGHARVAEGSPGGGKDFFRAALEVARRARRAADAARLEPLAQ